MPWPDPKQRRAIAARLSRDGKSREEISRFFREHGQADPRSGERRKKHKRRHPERRRGGDRRGR